MSPYEMTKWIDALRTILPKNRWENTPRRWFFGKWFWDLYKVYFTGKVRAS
jgi:hypothetical protein